MRIIIIIIDCYNVIFDDKEKRENNLNRWLIESKTFDFEKSAKSSSSIVFIMIITTTITTITKLIYNYMPNPPRPHPRPRPLPPPLDDLDIGESLRANSFRSSPDSRSFAPLMHTSHIALRKSIDLRCFPRNTNRLNCSNSLTCLHERHFGRHLIHCSASFEG
jgi:hypothetical protein